MEGSLDDLIRFLLEEIALCGQQGALPSHVLNLLDHYFRRQVHDAELTNTVDRPFQEQAWKWLARHPDIKVGRNGEGNCMDLADVVAHNERVENLTQQSVTALPGASITLTAIQGSVSTDADATAVADGRATTGAANSLPAQPTSVLAPSDNPSILHVFVSVNRMWLAVAGHGIDHEKIAALDFTCLSIIAAHREHGILQPELVRMSGQDKRSVPWRTQKLCDNGYIIKKEVVASGARTSLCVLKRFAAQSGPREATTEDQYPASLPESVKIGGNKGYVDAKSHVVETRIRATFDLLKELKIILWDDLKIKLACFHTLRSRKRGIWRKARESRQFAVTIRKLEFLKCVQRVRASEQKDGTLHRCVKILREPTKEEYDMLCDTKHKIADFIHEKELDDTDDELENTSGLARVAATSEDTMQMGNEIASPKVLMWTPDRLMVNVLHDAIILSGSKGMSSMDIKNIVIGTFFERPIEHLLTRLVQIWQCSQPQHLRYLAILRDTTLTGKTQHYVYYSYDVFKSLVDAGKASWEAVETVKRDNSEIQGLNVASDSIPDVDEYGFPKLDKAEFQGHGNVATLAECITAAKISKFRVTASDAFVSKLKDGSYCKFLPNYPLSINGSTNKETALKWGQLHGNGKSKSNGPSVGKGPKKNASRSVAKRDKGETHERIATKKPKKSARPDKTRNPRGRPRKYPKIGLPENASSLTLEQLCTIQISQKRAIEYERSKITNEIASRVEQGEDVTQSTERVLAEVATRNEILSDPVVSQALESFANITKKRKRPTIPGTSYNSVTYTPSVLAHSFLVPNLSEVGSPICHNTSYTSPAAPTRTLKKLKTLPPEENPNIPSLYLPSILAHSLLVCEAPKTVRSAAATTLEDLISSTRNSSSTQPLINTGKKPYRSRKFGSAVGYFPSTLAHTNASLATISRSVSNTKTRSVKPLDTENNFANLSPNITTSYLQRSMSGLHDFNSGDSNKPNEVSVDSLHLFHPTEVQSDIPLASSGTLSNLVRQTQAMASSTSRKRNADKELPLASQTIAKRPRISLSSNLVRVNTMQPGYFESKIGYLPSIAAHTHFWLDAPEAEHLISITATAKKKSRPRKKTAKAQEVEFMDQMMENSTPTQIPQRMHPHLTYEEQLGSTTREKVGVYLGRQALLKVHRRGRPRQSRLIVFKSPRLSTFSWFIPESTQTEGTYSASLSAIENISRKEIEDNTLSSILKSPSDAPRPQSQMSQAREDFLLSVRDTLRLSKTAELSYSTSDPAIADAVSPSIASITSRKRKRNSASTDVRQPLRRKVDNNAPSKKNSQLIDLSPKALSPSPKDPTLTVGSPPNAELVTLLPSIEQNLSNSAQNNHGLIHSYDVPNSTFVHFGPIYTSTIAQLGIANYSAAIDMSASATAMAHRSTEATGVSDVSFSTGDDIEVIGVQFDDATVRTRDDERSPVESANIAPLATSEETATNQNAVPHTPLQTHSLVVPARTLSINTTEGNFARTEIVPFVNTENQASSMISASIEPVTRSDPLMKDDIRPTSVPNITMLDSWLLETSEQVNYDVSSQRSAISDSMAFAKISTISSMVALDTDYNQRDIGNAGRDTMSQPHMETNPSETLEIREPLVVHTNDSSQVPAFTFEPSMQGLTNSRATKNITRAITTGGSVAVLRRKIIMEIVEQCGGVFPGDREIWQPFCDVWKSRNGSGKPDHRTVLAAVKYLVDNGKLRKLKFTFNHEGIATTRSIVTGPDISPTDPKVKDLRQKMIDHAELRSRQKMYIPEEAKVFMTSAEVVDKPLKKARPLEIDGQLWTNRLEIAAEQVKLQYPARLKRSSRGLFISQGMERRRIERESKQARLLREVEEEMSEPDFAIEGYRHSEAPTLSEAAGTYEFRWREFNPATDEISTPKRRRTARIREATLVGDVAESPSTRATKTNSHRLMRLHVNSRPRANFLSHSHSADVRQFATNFNEIQERHKGGAYPPIQFMEVMDQHSNFDKELSPEQDDFDQEQSQWLLVDRRLDRLNPPGRGDLLNVQSEHQKPRVRKTKITKLHKLIQKQLQDIGIQYRVAARRRKTKLKSVKLPRGSPSDSAHVCVQVSPLMDPEHLFHTTTGTFSSSYAGMLDIAEVPDVRESSAPVRFNDPVETAEVDLPCSLQDALSRPYDLELVAHIERSVRVGFNPDHDPFLELVDKVRKWELGTPNLANTTSKDWKFINFQLLEPQETAKEVFQTSVFVGLGNGNDRNQKYQRKFIHTSPRPVVPAKRPTPVSKPAARRANLARPPMTRTTAIEVPVDVDGRLFKKVTLRGPKLQAVSSEDDRRILIAVVIVRTLVGGSEQFIDWVLLARIFGSRFSERLLHRRWVSVRVRFKRSLEKLTLDFQDMFLLAYENGTIPPLDFDNYDDYDWNWLIDWTMKNLEAPVKNLNKDRDLPNTRTELEGLFELRKPLAATNELAQFYELDAICAIPKRHAVIHKKPHVIPIHISSINMKESTLREISKTWVRANVITPDEGYDAHLARDKLTSLGEANIEAAVKDLLSARVILQANKGRLIPGRNYDMTEYSLTRLRRKLDAHTFRQAAAYKARLDTEFEKEGLVAFSCHTGDGDVMAILNLAAHGRIRIVPKNPPMEIFGLLENGYRTRHMDKIRLNFDIDLKPTAAYLAGNPLLPFPPPPGPVPHTFPSSSADNTQPSGVSTNLQSTLERFPFWIGINNSFVPVAWDLALAAVLSLLSIQPGVSAEELAKTLRPALEAWEIALIFQWCVQAGLATWADEEAGQSSNGGVKLAEWWWLGLGNTAGTRKMGTRRG
ncbi:hypothetical protein MMC11_008464 [Xylographa trunciseda]|nr:hypothetical protein [Xylographa trunciseda]